MEQDKQGEEKKLPETLVEKKASLEGLSPFTQELLEETFQKIVAERQEALEAAQKREEEGVSRVEKRAGTEEQIKRAEEAGNVLVQKVQEASVRLEKEVEQAKAGTEAPAPKAEAPEKPVASLGALAEARARGDWDEVARMNNELNAQKGGEEKGSKKEKSAKPEESTIEKEIQEAKKRGDTKKVAELNDRLWKAEMEAKGRPTELGRAGVVPDKPKEEKKEEQKYPPVPAELPKTTEPVKVEIPPIPKAEEAPKALETKPKAEKKEAPTHKEESKHEEAHEAPHAEEGHKEATPPDVVRAIDVSEIRAEEPVLTEREKEVQSELRKISTDGNFDLKNLEDPKKLAKLLKLEKEISEEEKLRRLQIGFDAAVTGLGEASERYSDIQKAFEKGSEGIKGGVFEEEPKPVETIEPEKKEIEGAPDALNLAALKEASDKAKQEAKSEEGPKEAPKQKPEFTREQAEKFAKLSLPPERKGRLREFAEGVKETALEKWEELKKEVSFPAKNVIDKFRFMWNDRAFDRHTIRAEEAYRDVVTANDRIAVAEGQLRAYDAERAAVRSRLGGVDTVATARLAIKERKELVKTVEKLKVERRSAQERLENQNRFRAMFENKRKNIAREFHERIKDRLDPIESRIKEARGARDKFDAEVESFALATEKNEARLEALQQGMKEAWSKVDKLQYGAAIKETKEALRTGRKMLSLRLEKRGELERALAVLETHASPYRVKINELALLSKRDEVYKNAELKVDEEPDWSFRNSENESSSAGVEAKEEPQEETQEESREERGEKRLDIEMMVSKWNTYFGSDMNIQSERMRTLGAKSSGSFASYERLILAYWRRMQGAGNTRVTEKKIRANMKFLKVALANESNE